MDRLSRCKLSKAATDFKETLLIDDLALMQLLELQVDLHLLCNPLFELLDLLLVVFGFTAIESDDVFKRASFALAHLPRLIQDSLFSRDHLRRIGRRLQLREFSRRGDVGGAFLLGLKAGPPGDKRGATA